MANKEIKVDNKIKKSFFKGFKAELKKVIWPTPKQLINSTTAVITIVIVTAIIVFALDMMFKTINEIGVNQLRSWVQSREETDENLNEDSNQEIDNTQNEENVDSNIEVNE